MAAPAITPRRWSVLQPLPLWARLFLGMVAVLLIGGYYQMRALGHFQSAWIAAHRTRDVASLEALVCWDGVEEAERQRMRLLLAQEVEHPLRTTVVRLGFGGSTQAGWKANRFVLGHLDLVYDTPERLTVSFPLGFASVSRPCVVMMVREK
jgi:hypothetical protein